MGATVVNEFGLAEVCGYHLSGHWDSGSLSFGVVVFNHFGRYGYFVVFGYLDSYYYHCAFTVAGVISGRYLVDFGWLIPCLVHFYPL